jgi:hypothetical protein
MAALLLTILGPTLVFGAFALLAMRFGAESRPFFDERPVVDDRPNWFPIARSAAGDEDDEDDEPGGGEPVPAVAGAPGRPRRARAVPVADAG